MSGTGGAGEGGAGMLGAAPAMTPREIVGELDRYIIGQDKAKRAVAVALRNRWRRQQVAPELREEIAPKNIIMIGPTGVGKTEIARRLAKLARAPFIKVEASKFTEVGYVGRDVESMIRDLVEQALQMLRAEETDRVRDRARDLAKDRLVALLVDDDPAGRGARAPGAPGATRGGSAAGAPPDQTGTFFGPFLVTPPPGRGPAAGDGGPGASGRPAAGGVRVVDETEARRLRQQLDKGELDDREVELDLPDSSNPFMTIFGAQGQEEMDLGGLLSNVPGFRGKTKRRKVSVPDALRILEDEEAEKLVDIDRIKKDAVARTEQAGIVFLDEVDKVAGRQQSVGGPDVSREGVQRDLLPIVEGSTVMTKYGPVKTDHILFIAAGAFHVAKVSDLIPELQGRFPIRVELDALMKRDFVRILTEPRNALTKQYQALLGTEGVTLEWGEDALEAIADYAQQANERSENIGARRLHTILEALLEELSFQAPERAGDTVRVDRELVRSTLEPILGDEELSRYIL